MTVQMNAREQEKRFQGMAYEKIDNFSSHDYEEYERARMERNAWTVVEEVQNRVDYAPVVSEYITAYTFLSSPVQFSTFSALHFLLCRPAGAGGASDT